MITISAPVWLWNSDKGSWHFVSIPPEQGAELRLATLGERRGFGSLRVDCAIGEVRWRTSVFPNKDGGYVLPIKADVRRRAELAAGDEVTLTLEPV